MEGNARTWFTPKQRAELWERWKSGQCVADIARALERRNKSGVYRVLAINGGIAPSPRRRAPTALKLEEAKRYRVALPLLGRYARLHKGLDARHQLSAGRSDVTAAAAPTALVGLIGMPGIGRCAPSPVVWRAMQGYDGASRRSSRCSGRRSRSPAG